MALASTSLSGGRGVATGVAAASRAKRDCFNGFGGALAPSWFVLADRCLGCIAMGVEGVTRVGGQPHTSKQAHNKKQTPTRSWLQWKQNALRALINNTHRSAKYQEMFSGHLS